MVTRTEEQAPAASCCPLGAVRDGAGEHLEHSAAVFKALADPTRLRLLKAVAAADETCECYLVPTFPLSQPTISYHLKVLREAGLITSERRGQWVYHRVNPKAVLSAARDLIETIQ
jgi:ArsR family transcriptional regulator